MIKALQNVAGAKIQVLVRTTLIEVCVAVLFLTLSHPTKWGAS